MPDIVKQLDYIFKPRSIAVIGASQNVTKWGYMMVNRPLSSGFKGKVYPVNSKEATILGQPCFRSLNDIPATIDLAVITVPMKQVPHVMQECAEKGVKGVVLITAGFAETGIEGKQMEEHVLRIARSSGIRFVGPNGMGIYSASGNLNLAFDSVPKAGYIAFISQSGTYGGYMAEIAKIQGYGLRMFVSAGNQTDLNATDYIEYLGHDDETRAIILYLEGVKEGRRFIDTCREVVKKKPVLIFKGGSTPAGKRATLSHTSSIAGSDNIFDSACRQSGVIRTQEAFHTFEMAIALVNQPLLAGRRIGIVGTGGQGVVVIDACQKLGLEIPEFDNHTAEQLMQMLPPHAPMPRNPVDFAGSYRTAMDEARVVEAILKLDYIDGVITNLPINPIAWGIRIQGNEDNKLITEFTRISEQGITKLCRLPQLYGKPIVCMRFHAKSRGNPFEDMLIKSGIPIYDTPEQSARAMYGLSIYSEIRKRA